MTDFDALIFDFDGVLIESELSVNQLCAELLTSAGHPTTLEESLTHYMGLTVTEAIAAIEARIGCPVPTEFHEGMREGGRRALAEGLAPVAGAVEFVRALPCDLPKAVASSSSTEWMSTHLRHLGLGEAFGPHLYSGKEHVTRGKPAPDLYLHAAQELGVGIERTVVIEDSKVGATGAVASGATVIGLAAGRHCLDGHGETLRSLGVTHVAHSFDEVARLLGVDQTSRRSPA